MAHYAFLDDSNIVTEVIVGVDETETIDGKTPEEWYGEYRGQRCVRTSYSSKIRYNFAGIGHRYDPIDDAFIGAMPECGHEALFLNDKKRWECETCAAEIMQSGATA
jgi:hypothetical protein